MGEGSPEPLGASVTAGGLNVAVWSVEATAIEVCLFDPTDGRETARIALTGRTGYVFHGLIEGVGPGALYGLRAHGPWDPARGRRFNPRKLLVDPYALALDRPFSLHPSLFALGPEAKADSAPFMPKAIVTGLSAIPPPPAPRLGWSDTVIYELSVRGFTKTHPDIPEALRGTFAGLGHPVAIGHLKALGVTAVELLPASAWIDERHLPPLGLTNAWGYNPVAYLAPDPRLAPGGWPEVRAAVDALTAAGIETLLDVVFNHTGEGDALGPTLSMRGLDNAAWYRLEPGDPAGYLNDAGTGNTLALNREPALRLAMDALRAWRRWGGMAGFRFDLATVLGRGETGFDASAPLLAAIGQDPELRDLKLIAEPWDCGPGGYQLGRFPPAWGEWNDRYRDTLRGFWRGDPVSLGALASRLAGSQDLFAGRRPSRSVNFVVAHDGFTLADLVSYGAKHNLANGEDGRDGTDHNLSWNNGVEGPSDDPAVTAARVADQRALLASLLLSRGTPMLSMGAEMGQTQGGNNNAYAQDNETSWLNWAGADASLLAFTRRLLTIRRDHLAPRTDRFLTGAAPAGGLYADVEWRRADGAAMTPADWNDADGTTLAAVLTEPDGDGLDRVVLVIHRGGGEVEVALPEPRDGFAWSLLADSADPGRADELTAEAVAVARRSVLVLAETPAPARRPKGVDDAVLARLADAAGIASDWWDVDGSGHTISPDTQKALLAAMELPADTTQRALASQRDLAERRDRRPLPLALVARDGGPVSLPLPPPPGAVSVATWLTIQDEDGSSRALKADGMEVELPPLALGRYTLTREDAPDAPCRLIVAPAACHAPAALTEGRRRWGLSAQIYGLRRAGDQGVGDFTTLGRLARQSAQRGAAIVGVNPLHALFNTDRDRASPYYPSDRRFLDPIYLDLDRVPGSTYAHAEAAALAGSISVDYPAVWAMKVRALESAFGAGRKNVAFAAFVAAGGEALARFGRFEANAEARGGEPDRVRFHQFLQWLCELQLAAAARDASGLDLGLCRDLAVGAAPDGAEIWSAAHLVARGVSIGAPPDPFGPQGQVWGLPPYDPHRLRADGYRLFGDLLAANMRHAGALRIDHVMGLARQFWVPDGAEAADGAYVAFPLEDLLGVLTLESHKARCLVVGEDLGTVPPGLRETLADAGLLSYRVLPFERDGGRLRPPDAWPRAAWACVATHDLPPLAGWWVGVDIDEREHLGILTGAAAGEARDERLADKGALVEALAREGLGPKDADPAGPLTDDLAAAIHAYVAQSDAALAIAQVEDLAGERAAVNLPGTDRERPNWRRRLTSPVETLFDSPLAGAILAAIGRDRGPKDPP